MLCHYNCSQLLTMLFSIATPDSGSAILFHIVDNCEQCEQHNIVHSSLLYSRLRIFGCFSQAECRQHSVSLLCNVDAKIVSYPKRSLKIVLKFITCLYSILFPAQSVILTSFSCYNFKVFWRRNN